MASQKLLNAASLFVERALKADDSLFTPGQPIWSLTNLDDLHRRFIDRFELGEGNFIEKLNSQLNNPLPIAGDATPPATFQLMGELIYVSLLPIMNMGGDAKRKLISEILSWSPAPVQIPRDLAAALDDGVTNSGRDFNMHPPYNLKFLIEFAQAWKQQPAKSREMMLADPWAFRTFAFALPIESAQSQREWREWLLCLVHPNAFQHIAAETARPQTNEEKHAFAVRVVRSLMGDDDELPSSVRDIAKWFNNAVSYKTINNVHLELKKKRERQRKIESGEVTPEQALADIPANIPLDPDEPDPDEPDPDELEPDEPATAPSDDDFLLPDLDAPTYVIIHKNDREVQRYGQTYTFGSRAGGSWKQLSDDLYRTDTGDKPVQFIIYRPAPYHAFTAWATAGNVQTKQAADGEQVWQVELKQHEFPNHVPAKELVSQIGWLSRGLAIAFRGISIRKISSEEVETIMNAVHADPLAQAVANTGENDMSETHGVTGAEAGLSGEDQIWIALQEIEQQGGTATIQQIYDAVSRHMGKPLSEAGRSSLRFFVNTEAVKREYVFPYDKSNPGWHITPKGRAWLASRGLPPALPLDTYLTFATMLTDPSYTADELLAKFGRIQPPLWQGTPPIASALLEDMRRLRLLEPLGEGRYRRWAFLVAGTLPVLRRLCVLAMLLPDGTGGYTMPATYLPLDGQPHLPAAWHPLDEARLDWYVQAGILQHNPDGSYQSLPGALAPASGSDSASTTLNDLLQHLHAVRSQPARSMPEGDLPRLDAATLDQRIREIQRDLLIDRQTILRIYRALIAGQHVILSGPPGTGKTHLATRLPAILWREQREERYLPADPDLPPNAEPRPVEWHGYHTELVTATEDWGVRDVIGGIAPHLSGSQLSYCVRHGCLVRAVLGNYAGYRDGSVPNPERRTTPIDDAGRQCRGQWLVIDEFTRAPIDAAFGSLLTTLGGSSPVLRVPTDAGEVPFPMPADFRIIGTLNSFDRHFLNQISEAMKRRFVFIDILPPAGDYAHIEYAAALYHELPVVPDDPHAPERSWQHNNDTLTVRRLDNDAGSSGAFGVAYKLDVSSTDPDRHPIKHVQYIFKAIRVYRQLGTAQVRAVYKALLTGVEVGMPWDEALDTAFADTLADQLQILTRDEQQVLLTYLAHAGDADAFAKQINTLLAAMAESRKKAHPFAAGNSSPLTATQLSGYFALGEALALPAHSLFVRRLQGFLRERGL